MNERPIGIFDSGMGGLTVMQALAARLPGETFVYLGDTARLPYGTKSAETVRRYAMQASRALMERGVKLLVVACNTASVSLPALEEALVPLPIIGVILPGAEAALAAAPEGPIAVIATEGTVNGGAYAKAIRARAPEVRVMQQACPLFVPMTEEGLTEGPIVEAVAHRYLDGLLGAAPRPRCLLLGCTHYPVLRPTLAKLAPGVTLVDSAGTTAEAVARLLQDRRLSNESEGQTPRFLVTDAPERFARVGEIFLGRAIDAGAIELVDLQS